MFGQNQQNKPNLFGTSSFGQQSACKCCVYCFYGLLISILA